MRTISFRYNKYSPSVLYIIVIFGVSLGFLAYYAFLMYSGIGRGPEFAPPYFRENPRHAVYLIFGLIPVALLLPALLAIKYWSNEEEEGQISLSEEYAVLYDTGKAKSCSCCGRYGAGCARTKSSNRGRKGAETTSDFIHHRIG